MVFVPFSLVFGSLSDEFGVFNGGWLIFVLTLVSSLILAKVSLDRN
jgi:hypothetical protein